MAQPKRDFCPLSQACEILSDRWTPLVMREIVHGRLRFGEMRRGLPRIPTATLTKRLRTLERAGVIERIEKDGVTQYHPTDAGLELEPVLVALAGWGERWIREPITDSHVDPAFLMWEIRRTLEPDRMPDERVVVRFEFLGAPARRSRFWLILHPVDLDLCVVDPGYEENLVVRTRPGPLGRWYMGDAELDALIADGEIECLGSRRHVQGLTDWLTPSAFAAVQHPPTRPRVTV